ncbi:MAG: hypothetical protein RL309_316 [Verrucomicrobiota bacterium]
MVHADNFGNGGNFDWDQKNQGVEGGIDFAVTDLAAASDLADSILAQILPR